MEKIYFIEIEKGFTVKKLLKKFPPHAMIKAFVYSYFQSWGVAILVGNHSYAAI